jgi:MFS family permease
MNKPTTGSLSWSVIFFVTAKFISSVGTWLFIVATSWLMTELDSSALMVSLVQSATTVPLFLFALPAGALGDVFDRRRSLLITQTYLTLSTLGFAAVVYFDLVTVKLLLLFTFLNGIGAAFSRPIMAAIVPQLVDKAHLRRAVNLSSMSFNLSRAVGPVIGGYLITRFTIDLPIWIDAATFFAVLVYLFFWRDNRAGIQAGNQPPLALAIRDSWRFFRYSPALQHSILKATTFFFAGGALWALLPLVARIRLAGNADLYGYLVGAVGAGAVLSSFIVGRLTAGVGANLVMITANTTLAAGLCVLGWSTYVPLSLLGAGICGMAWQAAYTTLMTSTQYSLPHWFGARGLAYYLMAVALCLGLGSATWGWLADMTSLSVGYYAAAGTLIVLSLVGRSFRLDRSKDSNLDLSSIATPVLLSHKSTADSPRNWLITRYTFAPSLREEVMAKLSNLGASRYRSGAIRWAIHQPDEAGTLEEHNLTITGTNYAAGRFQTTVCDAGQEEDFLKWFSEQGGQIEREIRPPQAT